MCHERNTPEVTRKQKGHEKKNTRTSKGMNKVTAQIWACAGGCALGLRCGSRLSLNQSDWWHGMVAATKLSAYQEKEKDSHNN